MNEANSHPDTSHGPELSPADVAALDALVESGFAVDPAAAVAEPGRVRRASALLDLLNSSIKADEQLVDVTLARVHRAGRRGAASGGIPELIPHDHEALESWIMHSYDASRVAPSLRERARRHDALASLVTSASTAPPEARSPLVEQTLARVQAEIDRHERALDFVPARSRRGTGIRLADLVSVAAVVLIGAAVVFPVLGTMREQANRGVCLTHLGAAAEAMSSYASANRDALPIANASLGGGRWWDVGQSTSRSNSANLFNLARAGYVKLADLACPGNPSAPTAPHSPDATDWRRIEEVSYSYQIMFGPVRPVWRSGPDTVILADRSPVVLRAVRGEFIEPLANAPNHRGAGQHTLRTDGSVRWISSPVLPDGDNIWLPRVVEDRIRLMSGQPARRIDPLRGDELPGGPDDTCLGP